MIGATVTLTGDKELDRKFAELPTRVEKKVLREALRPAAYIIHAAAQANVPVITGTAKESLKVRAGKRSRGRDDVSLAVITASGWFRGPAFYFPFDELGHHFGKRGLPNRRHMPGKRWLRNALQQTEGAARAEAQRRIAEGIEREAAAI